MTVNITKKQTAPGVVAMQVPTGKEFVLAIAGKELHEQLEDAGIEVLCFVDKVTLVGQTLDSPVLATVPTTFNFPAKLVKGTALALATHKFTGDFYKACGLALQEKGVVLALSKPDFTNTLQATENAVALSKLVAEEEMLAQVASPPDTSTLALLPPIEEGMKPAEPTAPVPLYGWPVCTIQQMINENRVILRDAKKMYQPVHGSSPAARYFVVAAVHGLKVAAYIQKGKKIAIRVEGEAIEQYKDRLKAVGFNAIQPAKAGGLYCSMHIDVSNADETMAGKVLGSVLAGLGLEWETPFPSASRLAAVAS